jgi:hypothetical protein
VVDELEHLSMHQWVRVYNNGIAELERVEELSQFRYFVYIVGGKAVPLFSLNVQFPWKTGIEATQACGKNLWILHLYCKIDTFDFFYHGENFFGVCRLLKSIFYPYFLS